MGVVFTDNFNRADSATLGGNWVEQSEVGGGADWSITSNKLKNETVNGFNYAMTTNTTAVGSADYEVEIDAPAVTGGGVRNVVGRYLDGNNYYYAGQTSNADCEIAKRVGGGETILASGGGFDVPATIKFSMQGTALTIYQSAGNVGSTTDSALTAEGNHGVLVTGTAGDSFDNYTVYDFAVVNLPPGLGPTMEMNPALQSAQAAMMR